MLLTADADRSCTTASAFRFGIDYCDTARAVLDHYRVCTWPAARRGRHRRQACRWPISGTRLVKATDWGLHRALYDLARRSSYLIGATGSGDGAELQSSC